VKRLDLRALVRSWITSAVEVGKPYRQLVLALFVACASVACGGGDPRTEPDPQAPAPAAAPTISAQPGAQSADAGQTATFSVMAAGSAPLTFQWRRNGVAIVGADLAVYVTPVLTSADDGAQFDVVVANAAGSVTSEPVGLTVRAAPGTTADRLLAAWAFATDSFQNQSYLQVVDPAAPTTLVSAGSALPVDANLGAPRAWTPRATQGYEVGMAPLAYYVSAGKVFQLSLRRSESQTPIQISSVQDACFLLTAAALVADASDAWVVAVTAGPDGSCLTNADNLKAFVRTGTPVTSPATFLPPGVDLPESGFPLVDFDAGRVAGFLMLDTRAGAGQLMRYSPDLTPAAPVGNASGLRRVRLLAGDSSDPRAQYLIVDGALRRLAWSAGQASLSNSLHTYASGSGFALGATDASGTYFSDGASLLRVVGDSPAQTLTATAASGGTIDGIYLTADHAIVHTSHTSSSGAISTIPKNGGSATIRIASGDAGSARVVGTSPSRVYYLDDRGANGLQEIRAFSAASGVSENLATGVQFIGSVWNRRFGVGALWDPIASVTVTGLSAFLYCVPQSGERNCAMGTVRRHDVASARDESLANIDHNLAVNNGFRFVADNFNLYEGLPGSLIALVSGVGRTASGEVTAGLWGELYVLRDDPTAPLARVTRLAP
jgi:hypothetical protein